MLLSVISEKNEEYVCSKLFITFTFYTHYSVCVILYNIFISFSRIQKIEQQLCFSYYKSVERERKKKIQLRKDF